MIKKALLDILFTQDKVTATMLDVGLVSVGHCWDAASQTTLFDVGSVSMAHNWDIPKWSVLQSHVLPYYVYICTFLNIVYTSSICNMKLYNYQFNVMLFVNH